VLFGHARKLRLAAVFRSTSSISLRHDAPRMLPEPSERVLLYCQSRNPPLGHSAGLSVAAKQSGQIWRLKDPRQWTCEHLDG
jgi:hypothetical protein